jgi:hypothetical protein
MSVISGVVAMAVTTVQLRSAPARKLNPLRGFGAQFNTNLFTRQGEDGPLSVQERQLLQARIGALKLGHSRIFVRPLARADGPQRTALMDTIELANTAGANVNLTWWKGPFPHAPQGDHAKKRKKLMEDFAGIIREAREKNFDCVTHVTIMNEVNSYDIAKQNNVQRTMELYNALYRDLDDALRKLSLRDSVELVGGDLVLRGLRKHGYGASDQDDWLEFMQAEMKDVLNGYSIHVYWEPHSQQFPKILTERLTHLPALGIEKPIYITEYGVRRLAADPRPGTFNGKPHGIKMEQSAETAFQHAWFNALAPQCGCTGLVKWILYKTSKRDEFGEWGMIGPRRGPLGPFRAAATCDITRLFNQLIGPNWTADRFSLEAGNTLLASAFKGPGSGQSVVVLNNTPHVQQVRLGVLTKNGRYNATSWQANGAATPDPPAQVTADGQGMTTINVPGRGLVALSTRPLPPSEHS